MIRVVEVFEATCDRCSYFGDPQADNEVPDGWAAVLVGEGVVEHYCPACAA